MCCVGRCKTTLLLLQVNDPVRASYGVDNALYAVGQLAQTTMRSELGKITLDKTFEEREALNAAIVHSINEAADAWGLQCLRYEIKDITPPQGIVQVSGGWGQQRLFPSQVSAHMCALLICTADCTLQCTHPSGKLVLGMYCGTNGSFNSKVLVVFVNSLHQCVLPIVLYLAHHSLPCVVLLLLHPPPPSPTTTGHGAAS